MSPQTLNQWQATSFLLQESKFQKLGLTAKAINGDTVDSARRSKVNLWATVEAGISLILVSPEMLSTPGFRSLIASNIFQSRLFAIGVDEVHLLSSWGLDFRSAYQQIGYIRKRFRDDVVMFGLSATLQKGKQMETVCKFLGFKEGRFKFIRCSNARPDIHLIFRTLRTTLASEDFPDLAWILTEPGKSIIFSSGIHLGFKLLIYLWNLQPENPVHGRCIRMYNSLNSVEFNRQTFELLEGDSGAHVVIATDKLSVGVDIQDIRTVMILDPKTLDDLWQKAGRAGRDKSKVKDPQVVVYIPRTSTERQQLERRVPKNNARRADGNNDGTIDKGLQAVINAACHVSEIDAQYDNQAVYPPCSPATCSTCASRPPFAPPSSCTCSGCVPEAQPMSSVQPKAPRQKPLPLSIRVTRKMRELAVERLSEFRRSCWLDADELTTGMIPMESYLPDPLIETLINSLPTFYTPSVLQSVEHGGEIDYEACRTLMAPFTTQNTYVSDRSHELVLILMDLHQQFDAIREQNREDAKTRRALKANAAQDGDEEEDQDTTSEEEFQSARPQSSGSSGIKIRIDFRWVLNACGPDESDRTRSEKLRFLIHKVLA